MGCGGGAVGRWLWLVRGWIATQRCDVNVANSGGIKTQIGVRLG